MFNLTTALTISIEHVATPGNLFYTERQFYYELCRTLKPIPGLVIRPTLWTLNAGIYPMLFALHRGIVRFASFTLKPPLSYPDFTRALPTYLSEKGTPSGLLSITLSTPLPLEGREPDLADYGLPRLLICQDRDIARMLRANLFHMEVSCAVLSLAEAIPLPEPFRRMLIRTAGARLYLLHDASPEGLALTLSLRRQLDLPPSVRMIAIGLRPAHAHQLHLFVTRETPPPGYTAAWPSYLTTRERVWLQTGWHAEVAAINPARLLRALRRIMLGIRSPKRRFPNFRHDQKVGFMTWPSTEEDSL